MENTKRLERFLRTVLTVCLLLLAGLTPVWWRQEHPALPAATAEAEETPEASPAPVDLYALRYREAETAAEAGLLAEALAVWEELHGYADSAARAEDCRARLYESAWELLLRRELCDAASLLRPLGDYRDSLRWLRYCERHQYDGPVGGRDYESFGVFYRPKHGQGTLYTGSLGLFYIPDETGPETQTLLYFPGGSDLGLHRLNTDAAAEYVERYAPDAVCLFAWESGFHIIEEHNLSCWYYLESLLRACALIPHEIVLVGTSNGFYAAERMALQLWDEEGLPVRALLSLDAGEDWGETELLLDSEELSRLAQAGTRLELFEQRKFKSEREVIQNLLRAGLAVDLIECDNGDHETITVYAFRLGVLSWALGECGLNEQQYKLTELKLAEKTGGGG